MFDHGVVGVSIPPPTLVNTTNARLIELLVDALQREHGPRRAALISQIGACKLPQAAPTVRVAMNDPDPLVRLEAVRSAGIMADATLRDDVARFLGDADPNVRREALAAAHAIDTSADAAAASPAVAAVLAEPNAPAAVMTAALRRAGPAETAAVASLLPKLPAALQPEAARALGRLNGTKHAEVLLPLLAGNAAQRAAAAAALGDLNAVDRLGAVTNLLADAHPTVRRAALAAFGGLAPVRARQDRAVAAMDDPDSSVRIAAATILARHPTIDAVPVLLRSLSDPHPELHDAARAALANPASAEMRELVTDRAAALLDDPASARRVDGSFLLGRLRSNKNAERHLSFLEIKPRVADIDTVLMVQAAESVGQIGVKKAGPLLAELARRVPSHMLAPNPKNFLGSDGHIIVFVACGKLAEPGVLPEAERLLNANGGQPDGVLGAAVFALGAAAPDADAKANGRLVKIATNEQVDSLARYEAIKALVRRRVPETTGLLQKLSESSPDAHARFAAHWATERLTGRRRPYVPPTRPWEAVTSISDLSLTPRE